MKTGTEAKRGYGVFGTRRGDRVKIFFRKARSLLYVDRCVCVGCGAELPQSVRGGLCSECLSRSIALGSDICAKCGRIVANEADYCDTCINRDRHFEKARSCFVYDGVPKKLIYGLKFGGKRYLAPFLAESMTDRYLDENYDCDCVIAVPLSEKRKKKRGYNQSELLAEEISGQLKLPLLTGALEKIRDNKAQAKLRVNEREENVRGAYEVKDKAAVKGKRILVVDDVITTGATASEVAHMLYKAKARSVKVLTYASTRYTVPSENIFDEEDVYEDEMV